MTKKRDWWLRREMVEKEERWVTIRREMSG
jgi:hypothetical protein